MSNFWKSKEQEKHRRKDRYKVAKLFFWKFQKKLENVWESRKNLWTRTRHAAKFKVQNLIAILPRFFFILIFVQELGILRSTMTMVAAISSSITELMDLLPQVHDSSMGVRRLASEAMDYVEQANLTYVQIEVHRHLQSNYSTRFFLLLLLLLLLLLTCSSNTWCASRIMPLLICIKLKKKCPKYGLSWKEVDNGSM